MRELRGVKVIAGGQTGADQAALLAANGMGVRTGGRGYRNKAGVEFWTEEGANEDLKELGVVECPALYGDQYGYNIASADLVLLFGYMTGGVAIMKALAGMHGCPVKQVYWSANNTLVNSPCEVAEFAMKVNAKTIAVGGNRESKNPGIGEFVGEWMMEMLEEMKTRDKVRF